jgi:hypothetical protein
VTEAQVPEARVPDQVDREATVPTERDTPTDEPTPLSAELVANETIPVKPEPEAPADSSDDSEQSSDEISEPPAIYDADVTNPNVPEPEVRAKPSIVWVEIGPDRNGRQVIKLSPSPTTANDYRLLVRYSVEQIAPSKRLLRGATRLSRNGVRLVRTGAKWRLGIGFERLT